MGRKKESCVEVSRGSRFFYHRSLQAHKLLSQYINSRYISRLDGSKRKDKPTTDIERAVTRHIEERNYLIFSLADRNPTQIKELYTWSLEALFQFLFANSIHAKRLEDQRLNAKQRAKTTR